MQNNFISIKQEINLYQQTWENTTENGLSHDKFKNKETNKGCIKYTLIDGYTKELNSSGSVKRCLFDVIHAARDLLSCLPLDLKAIICNNKLSIKDVSALASTNKMNFAINELLLKAKEEELNILFNEIKKQNFRDEVVSVCHTLMEKANTLTGPSNEKNIALRNAIVTLYNGEDFFTINSDIESYSIYRRDELLAIMMFSIMDTTDGHFIGNQNQNYSVFKFNQAMTYLEVLKKNQIKSDALWLEFYSSIEKTMALKILDVIRSNKSLKNLSLYFKNWDSLIVESIKNSVNESKIIEGIKIMDIDKPMRAGDVIKISEKILSNNPALFQSF